MRLHKDWCEAGFDPDAFWLQTPRLIRSAMAGYMERVYKAVEIAGGKVKREAVKDITQSPTQIDEAMQAWVRATRSRAG